MQTLKTAVVFKMASSQVVKKRAPELKTHLIFEKLIHLNAFLIQNGHDTSQLRQLTKIPLKPRKKKKNPYQLCAFVCFLFIFVCSMNISYLDGMMKYAFGVKCLVPNNYLIWEATRPLANCEICSNVQVVVLDNVTFDNFQPWAYSYKPIIARGAASDWPAVDKFDYKFFKDLFENTEGSYESVDEECQFLNFKTDLMSLKDVFTMPEERINYSNGTKPWYIGWSNCHPQVLKNMRKYYKKPHFLPPDAEHSHVDFIFMGYQQGAFMHLDYISRLMWQAQLKGRKTWRLNPPPECENVCKSHIFTVNPGDILLLDTRQWYHNTYVEDGEFSLTVSSEYG